MGIALHILETSHCVYTGVDYEQSLFFLGPSSKTCEIKMTTRVTKGARLERIALACIPLTKSEEKKNTARSLTPGPEDNIATFRPYSLVIIQLARPHLFKSG